MRITVDIYSGGAPKRGDLLQTNTGDKRERTCFIINSRPLKERRGVPRYRLDAVRWWEIEPSLRNALFRRAERHGGQRVLNYKRYPARKNKLTFEQYMRVR